MSLISRRKKKQQRNNKETTKKQQRNNKENSRKFHFKKQKKKPDEIDVKNQIKKTNNGQVLKRFSAKKNPQKNPSWKMAERWRKYWPRDGG